MTNLMGDTLLSTSRKRNPVVEVAWKLAVVAVDEDGVESVAAEAAVVVVDGVAQAQPQLV